MKKKLLILIHIILIFGFISSAPLWAEEIKVNMKISEKGYKHLELKNNFLKLKAKKSPVLLFNTESSMSKGSAALLGGGIGLVGGAGIGALIGSGGDDPGNTGAPPPAAIGAVIGGLSGLVIGGVTGYILGK